MLVIPECMLISKPDDRLELSVVRQIVLQADSKIQHNRDVPDPPPLGHHTAGGTATAHNVALL